MPSEKDTSTVGAMAAGLDPTEGRNVVEQVGPLVVLVLYVGILLTMAFDVMPNPDVLQGLMGILGPFIGAWIAKLGIKG